MNDPLYLYLKLIIENISLWPVLIVVGIVWLVRHPEYFHNFARSVSRLKLGPLEAEFRQIQKEIAETKEQVAMLEADLSHEQQRFQALVESFDPDATVPELATTRSAIKAMAARMDDVEPVRSGLAQFQDPGALYAAAEIARARRDPELFDDLVHCLDRLVKDDDLQGIRLHTVWTLTSALHKTVLADVKHGAHALTADQLRQAKAMLDRLVAHPKVINDRPNEPLQGISGPAKWAADWIDQGLTALKNSTE